ncbi:hypothetical protein CBOM_08083 [Ceraceosorus bombacis]|uniref:Uncharacterized protein n=1 Tax=Ceraceosorus bombacis TaxID=401625 RepID=A0A0P1BSK9_9BASI|nr:hypothetical protein CBOM_08083 [Ceraceosorus bombacis]
MSSKDEMHLELQWLTSELACHRSRTASFGLAFIRKKSRIHDSTAVDLMEQLTVRNCRFTKASAIASRLDRTTRESRRLPICFGYAPSSSAKHACID